MSDEVKTEVDAQAADDSSTLEQTVAAKMVEMQAKEDDLPVDTELEAEKVEQTEESEQTEKTEEDAKSDSSDEPTLPTGHRRAALARGYTSEEIDHFLKMSPEEALLKFEDVYNKWQDTNSRYSERGRLLATMDQTPDDKKEVDPEQIAPLDAQALTEQYGNEELVNALVGPLNKSIDKVNKALKQVDQSQEVADESKQEVLAQVIQEFLGSKEMKPYIDVYGAEIADLTKEQLDSRMELFGEADLIMCGAQAYGESISVVDALERAHAHVSRDFTDSAVRHAIREDMERRTKTLPAGTKTTQDADSDRELSDGEFETRTKARLAALRAKA